MLDKFHLEALDRSLKDLMGCSNLPFGGKIIILAGDFRQCLPVIKGASRAGIVAQCINKSHLWQYFSIFHLTENMRVRASGDKVLEEFDNWTLNIGNGTDGDGCILIIWQWQLSQVRRMNLKMKNTQ